MCTCPIRNEEKRAERPWFRVRVVLLSYMLRVCVPFVIEWLSCPMKAARDINREETLSCLEQCPTKTEESPSKSKSPAA